MNDYYVYAHIDPETDAPFYIGKGRGKRAFAKENRSFIWHMYVDHFCEKYDVKFMARNLTIEQADLLENSLINKFGKVIDSNGILTNITDGGYAEGAYIRLGYGSTSDEYHLELTECGEFFNSCDKLSLNTVKILEFTNYLFEVRCDEIRSDFISDLSKSVKPIKSWIVPFVIPIDSNSILDISLSISNLEMIIDQINEPVDINKLPSFTFIDNILFRTKVYFNLILQDNITLVINNEIISRSCKDWFFYRDYYYGYMKLIQSFKYHNRLSIQYLGVNSRNNSRPDIHDFSFKLK